MVLTVRLSSLETALIKTNLHLQKLFLSTPVMPECIFSEVLKILNSWNQSKCGGISFLGGGLPCEDNTRLKLWWLMTYQNKLGIFCLLLLHKY